jgi:hypothetical protein
MPALREEVRVARQEPGQAVSGVQAAEKVRESSCAKILRSDAARALRATNEYQRVVVRNCASQSAEPVHYCKYLQLKSDSFYFSRPSGVNNSKRGGTEEQKDACTARRTFSKDASDVLTSFTHSTFRRRKLSVIRNAFVPLLKVRVNSVCAKHCRFRTIQCLALESAGTTKKPSSVFVGRWIRKPHRDFSLSAFWT